MCFLIDGSKCLVCAHAFGWRAAFWIPVVRFVFAANLVFANWLLYLYRVEVVSGVGYVVTVSHGGVCKRHILQARRTWP